MLANRMRCILWTTGLVIGQLSCDYSSPTQPNGVERWTGIPQLACDPWASTTRTTDPTHPCYLSRLTDPQRQDLINEATRLQSGGQGAYCASVGSTIFGLMDRTYYRPFGESVSNEAGERGLATGQYRRDHDEMQISMGENPDNPTRTLEERLKTARHEAAHKLGVEGESSATDVATRCGPGGSGFSGGGGGGSFEPEAVT